jgi:hypothetical protein
MQTPLYYCLVSIPNIKSIYTKTSESAYKTTWFHNPQNKLAVQALTIHIFIQEVHESNLSWDVSYTDSDLSWFSSVPPDKFKHNTSIRP